MTALLPRVLRAATLCVVTAVALVLGSAPAWAHAELESSDPAEGASVAKAPGAVTLTFSEAVAPNLATISVSGPGGTRYEAGPATGSGPTLRVPLKPLGAAGGYTITYRVTSDDGHPISGIVPFTLTTPGPAAAAASPAASAPSAQPAPAPTAAASDDGGAPVWPWIVGAVVVVLGGAALALRRNRT
ncbi:copper resistance CopC family protein [Pseudonocardia endophytica]|uniref:copper resistance CopC family protein n=1 Tax=Pseudonocardia endophytica TaxID=401976 RepID=UPI001FB25BAE|nr:copper resistance CopC family protein [Pseudonocardia endophytica]